MKQFIKKLLTIVSTIIFALPAMGMLVSEYKPVLEREFTMGEAKIHQRHFDKINSTQTWSYDNVKLDPAKSTVWELVTADMQTAGIGTHNRKWISHIPGNVYATLSFPVEIVRGQLLPVSQLSALAAHDAIEQLSAIAVRKTVEGMLEGKKIIQIKWPNDVIVDGRKISGSMAVVSNGVCTLGIGINVNLTQDILDTIIEQKATSMFVATGRVYDEKKVLACYLDHFVKIIDDYKTKPDGFFDKFYEDMAFRGTVIKVHDDLKHPDKEKPCTANCYIEGVMEGVTDSGFLRLRTPDGIIKVYSGTVVKKES